MSTASRSNPTQEFGTELPAEEVVRRLRASKRPTVFLDGAGDFDEGWSTAGLIGLDPRLRLARRCDGYAEAVAVLDELSELLRSRRAIGGSAETGLLVLLSYDLFRPLAEKNGLPSVVAVEVDSSLRELGDGRFRGRLAPGDLDGVRRLLDAPPLQTAVAASVRGRPRTSLPRGAYLHAVQAVKERIRRGDIYQANLCQQFAVEYAGDPYETYRALANRCPAPHSAFLELDGFCLASVSPETFLRVSSGRVETVPIKGTRPRGVNDEQDREAARELRLSAKDRAELLMIVDLERNDLGRVCRTGSIEVTELAALRSFATVHHLVARVGGCLREGIEPRELIEATFPGGSITGAPKIKAMEILRELEPAPRGYFTGSLVWFGDDGSIDSSILIRSLIFAAGRCSIGAGGGIVADSDPEQEWMESNHKARALTRTLGFDPEEAS